MWCVSTAVVLLSVALVVAATLPHADIAAKVGLAVTNATMQFVGSCRIPAEDDGAAAFLVVQGPGKDGSGSTMPIVVSHASAATGTVHVVAQLVLPGNPQTSFVSALCTASGAVAVWTPGQLVLVNATGAVTVTVNSPQAVATGGGGLYVAVRGETNGLLFGFRLPSGAVLFTAATAGYPQQLLVQPRTSPTTGLPLALWVGGGEGGGHNGTFRSGATGAVSGQTSGGLFENAFAVVAAPVALVVSTSELTTYAFDWRDGSKLWGSNIFSYTTLAVVGNTVAGMSWQARTCIVAGVDAGTGAPVSGITATWRCGEGNGLRMFAAVPGSTSLVTAIIEDDIDANVNVVNVATGIRVFNFTAQLSPLPDDSSVRSGIVSACAGNRVVAAVTSLPADGFSYPTRVVVYDSETGAAQYASTRVFAGIPFSVSCGADSPSALAVVTTSTAVAALSLDSVTPPQESVKSEAIRLHEPSSFNNSMGVRLSGLWNVTGLSSGVVVTGKLATDRSAGASSEIVVLSVLMNEGNGKTSYTARAHDAATGAVRWSAPVCPSPSYTITLPAIAVDKAAGAAWFQCSSGSTALRMSDGHSLFAANVTEPNVAHTTFLPGKAVYTTALNVGTPTTSSIVVRGTTSSSYAEHFALVLSENAVPPEAMRVFTPVGTSEQTAVVLNREQPTADAWTRAILSGVDLNTGNRKWRRTMNIRAMPCGGVGSSAGTSSVRADNVVVLTAVDEGPIVKVPVIAGIDVSTGDIVWTVPMPSINLFASDQYFAAECSAISEGAITIVTADAARKISTVNGRVVWTSYDDRFFVPAAGNTFANLGTNEALSQGPWRSEIWGPVPSALVVTVLDGAWLLDPSTGARMGRTVSPAAIALGQNRQTFGPMDGLADVVLAVGSTNVSMVGTGEGDAGRVLSTDNVGSIFHLLSLFEVQWVGSAFDAAQQMPLAGLFNTDWLGVFTAARG